MALQPMNFDEHGQLVRALGEADHPPGNHFLARVFSRWGVYGTGRSWLGARIPSLLLSGATLVCWSGLAARYLSPSLAAGFALALLSNGIFLFNAVSNRAYALGLLLFSLWVGSLIRFTYTAKKRDAALAVVTLAALLGLGAFTHRMLYFGTAVGAMAFLLWTYQVTHGKRVALLTAAFLFAVWIGWPYLWDLFSFERANGLFYRGLNAETSPWTTLESISFFYVFGWDRAWQALLGFAFVGGLFYSALRKRTPTYGECFWIFLLLSLPAVGWGIGSMAWEPRFFLFFLPPGLFFLAESIDRAQPRALWACAAAALFIALPFTQAARTFTNSGGQRDLVYFMDVVARRVGETSGSCLSCSGAASHCRWVKHIYLPEERGFEWGNACRKRWVVRIAGNDEIPLPDGRLVLNFAYRKDYLLYEYTSP